MSEANQLYTTVELESCTRCNIEEEPGGIKPFVLVLFGGAGDLARRKLLPAIYSMYMRGTLPDRFTGHLFFSYGRFEEWEHYDNLDTLLQKRSNEYQLDILYYLSIPGALYREVIATIGESNLPTS